MNKRYHLTKGVINYPFFLFIALVTFFSCRREENLGLEVLPENNQVGVVVVDTFSIVARTEQRDSVRTDERGTMLAGYYNDPVFGSVNAKLYSQFVPEDEGLNLSDYILDSAVLTLRYDVDNGILYTKSITDSTDDIDPLSLMIYELDEDLYLDSSYYNSSSISVKPTLIGSISNYTPNIVDSIEVDSINEPPSVRIRLDDTWANDLLASGALSSRSSLLNEMKGLAIIADSNSSGPEQGTILYLNPNSIYTRLTFYYRTRTSSSDPYEVETFELIIDPTTARFNRYETNHLGSEVDIALGDNNLGAEKLYLQGLGGTIFNFETTSFMEYFKERDAIINLVEFIVPVSQEYNTYAPMPSAFFKAYDENGAENFIVDQTETSHIDGSFDSQQMQYRFVITRFIQNVILDYKEGEINNFGFAVVPTNEATFANRSVVNGYNPSSGDRIRLRIVYTPL